MVTESNKGQGPGRGLTHKRAAVLAYIVPLFLLVAPQVSGTAGVDAAPVSGAVPRVTHGVAVGEVGATTATIWSRCDRAATLATTLHAAQAGGEQSRRVPVGAAHDYTGKVVHDGLAPSTTYRYRAWCADGAVNQTGDSNAAHGTFRTAPRPAEPRAIRFAWGGDVGGQNVCRDHAEGYTVFDRVAEGSPDFFIALGDMIYADSPCRRRGRYGNSQLAGPPAPATDLAGFWAHWKYNRADTHLQRLLTTTPTYAVWDDHEIKSDAGPHHDTVPAAPHRHLLPLARHAFLDYQPLVPPAATPTVLYRNVRWGKHLELFILDTRQYRDANSREDSAERPKTMLGAAQRTWLLDGLRRSDATWKVIVSSVPLSVPTGGPPDVGRDGWANFDQRTGFEHELRSILRFMQRQRIYNHVWLTTDAHFAAAFRYVPFADDPQFGFHEFISGPMHAGVYRREEFDTTLGTERLFLRGPPNSDAISTLDEAKSWFNFGVIEISGQGELSARIITATGQTVYTTAVPAN